MSCEIKSESKLAGQMGPIGLALTVLAVSAPLTSASGYVPFAIMFGGIGTPLIIVLITFAMLLFTIGYMAMNKIVRRPGDFYSFISYGIGKSTGLGSGILAAVSYLLLLGTVAVYFGLTVATFIKDTTGIEFSWYWFATLCLLAVGYLGYLNVELSEKVLTWVMFFEVVVCLIFCFAVLYKGGSQDLTTLQSFSPSQLSHSEVNIPISMLFAVTLFLGFEATALFRDEVKNPDRTIPIATYGAVLFVGLLYTLCSYSLVQAYGANVLSIATTSPDTMFNLAFAKYVHPGFATAIKLLLMTSTFAAALSIQNVLARYLYNLGADGAVPSIFGKVHLKYGSPHAASVGVTIIALLVVGMTIIGGGSPESIYGALSGVGTAGVVVLMAIVNISILVWYARQGRYENANALQSLLAPSISSIFFFGLVYLVAKHFELLVGGEPGQYTWMFYALLGVQVTGMALGIYFKTARPEIYKRLGRSEKALAMSKDNTQLSEDTIGLDVTNYEVGR